MGVEAEEPGCMQKLTRYSFIIFNVLFTIIGLILVIAGSYGVAKANTTDIKELLHDTIAANIPEGTEETARSALVSVAALVITIGLITICISSCGWLGAMRQNTCLLFTFSISMVVIVLIEFILGITVVVVVKKFSDPENEQNKEWTKAITEAAEQDYANNINGTTLTKAWDYVQQSGDCCGVNGPNDWEVGPPNSCIDPDSTDGSFYSDGCYESYIKELLRISSAVGGVAITFCLVEIFGIVISCYLACTMRKGSRYEQH